MPVTFDAVATGSGNSPTVSWPHTVAGADRVIYVTVAERFASAVTGVTCGGVAMTQETYNDPGGNLVTGKVFQLLAPTVGVNSIVVSQSAVHDLVCTSISFAGVDQATPHGVITNSFGGPTTSISDTVTSATGEIVVDSVAVMENVAGTVVVTVGPGQTQRSNLEFVSANGVNGAVSTEPGATGVTMSWAIDVAAYWVHSSWTVKAATGDTTAPLGPTVIVQESPLGGAISLSITMPGDLDVAQYEVRRLTGTYPANDRSDGTIIVAPAVTSTSAHVDLTDSTVTNGTRYFYRVFCADTSGNWNTGTTASEVAASAMSVVGWYDSDGTLHTDGETGANPILEWTVSTANVEATKPVTFQVRIGSDNPGANQPPTQDVLNFLSIDFDGTFKYFTTSWVTVPVSGVPWANVAAAPVTCRLYTALNANQDLFASIRPEQV